MNLSLWMIRLLMIVLGILILGCAASAYQGSHELLPTEEQEEKASIFWVSCIIVLIVTEAFLLVWHASITKTINKK